MNEEDKIDKYKIIIVFGNGIVDGKEGEKKADGKVTYIEKKRDELPEEAFHLYYLKEFIRKRMPEFSKKYKRVLETQSLPELLTYMEEQNHITIAIYDEMCMGMISMAKVHVSDAQKRSIQDITKKLDNEKFTLVYDPNNGEETQIIESGKIQEEVNKITEKINNDNQKRREKDSKKTNEWYKF